MPAALVFEPGMLTLEIILSEIFALDILVALMLSSVWKYKTWKYIYDYLESWN